MGEGHLVLDYELSLAKARARRRLSQRLSLYKVRLLPLGEGGDEGVTEWTGLAFGPEEALCKARLVYGAGARVVQVWLDITEGALRRKRAFPKRRK